MADGRTWQPFATPSSPRQRPPRQHLWSIRKADGAQLDAELLSFGDGAAELQISRDLALLFGQRWPTRESALQDAENLKTRYVREGGTVVSTRS